MRCDGKPTAVMEVKEGSDVRTFLSTLSSHLALSGRQTVSAVSGVVRGCVESAALREGGVIHCVGCVNVCRCWKGFLRSRWH